MYDLTKNPLECLKCGWEWISHKSSGEPVMCPKCKSRDWKKPGVRKSRFYLKGGERA